MEGFQKLEVALRSSYEQRAGTPLERTLAISGAYVRFALDHPAVYSLLFRPELRQSSHKGGECDEAVKSAATTAFQILFDGLAASQRAGEIRTDLSVEMLALSMWSTMHGLTTLLLDHLLVENLEDHLPIENTAVSSRDRAEQLMAQVIQVVAQGLMVPS